MTTGSTNRRDGALDPRRRKLLFGLLFLAAGQAAMARGDLWVKEKILGRDGKPLGERTWIFAPDRVRFDDGATGFVIDATRERGWIYGAAGRCEALPAPGTGASSAPAAPAGTNEKIFAEVVGGFSPGLSRLAGREATRTIAQVEARLYEVVRDGETVQRRWIASSVQNPDLDTIVGRLQSSGRLTALMGLEAAQIASQSVGLGHAVRVEDLATGTTIETVELRRDAQPASAFSPPAGCPER